MSKIKILREDIRMTQQELGMKLGYPPKSARQYVSAWETGKRVPKVESLKKISKALNIDIEKLL